MCVFEYRWTKQSNAASIPKSIHCCSSMLHNTCYAMPDQLLPLLFKLGNSLPHRKMPLGTDIHYNVHACTVRHDDLPASSVTVYRTCSKSSRTLKFPICFCYPALRRTCMHYGVCTTYLVHVTQCLQCFTVKFWSCLELIASRRALSN